MQSHHTMILNEETPLSQWLSYLEQAHEKVIDLGLERVSKATHALNLTKIAPFIITVGGTNGKGTTCRLLEMLLLKAGYNVGVYSSPHLLHYRERVRINNQCLPDKEHCKSFTFIEKNKPNSLTYFEFGTLSAFNLFKQANLDVVILEVGLGGRLDATNIIDSDIAVVTSIDIDHTAFLGNTRAAIAFEKAGIFRANKPAIIGEPDAPSTLLNYAKELNCKLFCRNHDWAFAETGETWEWQSKDKHYQHLPKPTIPLANAATVLATLQYLPFTISDEILKEVLETVELTGRFQTLSKSIRQKISEKYYLEETAMPRIILDVGHNPHAARYLAERIKQLRAKVSTPDFSGKIYALCGVLRDKDLEGILTPLIPVMDGWNCLTLNGERGQSGNAIVEKLKTLGVDSPIKSFEILDQGLNQILSGLNREDTLIIFGSFHTVAELFLLIEE